MNITDWILNAIRLNPDPENEIDNINEIDDIEEYVPKLVSWNRNKKEERHTLYGKVVNNQADADDVIDKLKERYICVVIISRGSSPRERLNYLAGAVYAINGQMAKINDDVYVLTNEYEIWE